MNPMTSSRQGLSPAAGWLIAFIIVFFRAAVPALAAQITVTGPCTLVDAIQAANGDTAIGSCPAGESADTIILTEDVVLTQAFDSSIGLPVITSDITIEGNGFEIRRDSLEEFRILRSSDRLTLDFVTVRGAFVDDGGCGGGLLNLSTATTTIIGSTVTANRVTNTQSFETGGFGAGICNFGNLTIRSSAIVGNSADADSFGVGIYNEGTLEMSNSTISGNSTGGGSDTGAGILNFQGTTTITHCTFSGHSTNGAGSTIFSLLGTVSIANSIIEGLATGGSVCSGTPAEIVDLGGNLQFPDTSCGAGIPSTDSMLGPLADNNGPTKNHLPGAGSPAVDSAQAAACEGLPVGKLDQRGASRGFDDDGLINSPEAGDCDIGSVERNGFSLILRARFETGDFSEWSHVWN